MGEPSNLRRPITIQAFFAMIVDAFRIGARS